MKRKKTNSIELKVTPLLAASAPSKPRAIELAVARSMGRCSSSPTRGQPPAQGGRLSALGRSPPALDERPSRRAPRLTGAGRRLARPLLRRRSRSLPRWREPRRKTHGGQKVDCRKRPASGAPALVAVAAPPDGA